MGSIRHTLGEVEGAGAMLVAGHLRWNGTTSALSISSSSTPLVFNVDITAYRLAAGLYQVNIGNFRGPQGIVIPVVTVGSSSIAAGGAGGPIGLVPLSATVGSGSYITNTDTYGFVIGVASASTFTDADVNFIVLGY